MTFGQFFTGVIIIIIGIFYVKYHAKIAEIVGDLGFGNKIFGGGGEYTLHQVIGILLIVIGILWSTGGFQILLAKLLGNLFGGAVAPKSPAAAIILLLFH